MTFVEFMRANQGMKNPCTCGAKPGFAHPETCGKRKSYSNMFDVWRNSGDPDAPESMSSKDCAKFNKDFNKKWDSGWRI